MADKTERQEIDPFPVDGDWETQRDWIRGLLKKRSRDECVLLAGRAALRALPMLRNLLTKNISVDTALWIRAEILLPLLRCYIVLIDALLVPPTHRGDFESAWQAIDAAFGPTEAISENSFHGGSYSKAADSAADAAYRAAHYATNPAVTDVEFSVHSAIRSAAAASPSSGSHSAADAFSDDTELLEKRTLHVVIMQPLWSNFSFGNAQRISVLRRGASGQNIPAFFLNEWAAFSATFRKNADDWDVWVDWFDGVYRGRRGGTYIFGLPTVRALKLWHDVAMIDDAIWKAGPATLNAEFKRLVVEAKVEVANTSLQQSSALNSDTSNNEKLLGAKRSKAKFVEPKTKTGKAIFANAGHLALHTYSLVSILDSELQRITLTRPNSDEAIKEHDQLIVKIEHIKSDVLAFQSALIAFSSAEISEKEIIKKADSVLKPFRDCWTEKGKEFVEIATRSGLFLGAMAIAQYCGVPPLAGTLVFGAISSGKPLVEVLKAAKGIFKLT